MIKYIITALAIIPFIAPYECDAQKVNIGLEYFYRKYDLEGRILLYDENKRKYHTNKRSKLNMRVLPGTAFQLMQALVYYQLGMVKDKYQPIRWDGTAHTFNNQVIEEWNRDTNFEEAFKSGNRWVFEDMAESIEYKIFKKLIKKTDYGNVSTSRFPNDTFWDGGRGHVTIKLKDQIKFLRKLKNDDLLFETNVTSQVKTLMKEQSNSDYMLYGCVGLLEDKNLILANNIHLGYYLGYIEIDDNTYYFASYIKVDVDDTPDNFLDLRKQIVYDALLEVFEIDIAEKKRATLPK